MLPFRLLCVSVVGQSWNYISIQRNGNEHEKKLAVIRNRNVQSNQMHTMSNNIAFHKIPEQKQLEFSVFCRYCSQLTQYPRVRFQNCDDDGEKKIATRASRNEKMFAFRIGMNLVASFFLFHPEQLR